MPFATGAPRVGSGIVPDSSGKGPEFFRKNQSLSRGRLSRRRCRCASRPRGAPFIQKRFWRIDDEDPSRAWPEIVTLSYHEAGRYLDAQERVDTVPLPAEVRDWLQAYNDQHYRPEPRQRRRPASFQSPHRR